MAKYPVKMLKDEQNQPFVPLVSAESIYTNDDLSFEEKFATKLEADNLKEGNGIILEQNGNDTTISVDFGATDNIIDNLNDVIRTLEKISRYDEKYDRVSKMLRCSYYEIQEACCYSCDCCYIRNYCTCRIIVD